MCTIQSVYAVSFEQHALQLRLNDSWNRQVARLHPSIKEKELSMAGKNTAVFGIYTTRRSVENAVDSLKVDGFPEHRHFGVVAGE